ncbi:MAG: acyltransferase [Deltaproteobacteria bacterium]|nr:acyltransferase [Deltaproteobacteria bacterium]MBW2419441.1 acyltransferase [Deltaproteobacteria bacterium]
MSAQQVTGRAPTSSGSLPFHPALDGLRGVAVVVTMIFHAGAAWLPGGFLGLSTFFTLSGFLITGLVVVEWEKTGRVSMPRFWSRRVRRLMPACMVVLLAIAIGGPFFADELQLGRLRGDGFASLFYYSNWWFIATGASYDNLQGSPSLFQHFWSLSVEEQYYIAYPLCTLALLSALAGSRRACAAVLIAAAAISWVWMAWLGGTDVTTDRIYYGTDTRCAEFIAGGVLAMALSGRAPLRHGPLRSLVLAGGVLGLLAGGYAWTIANTEAPGLYGGGFALYTLATVAVIAAAVQSGGPTRAFLSSFPLRTLGRISYGAYLYHWPIFLWLDAERTGLSPAPLAILRFALTVTLAYFSYRWLEEPIRSGRRVLSRRRWLAPSVAVGCVVAALLLATSAPLFAPAAPQPVIQASKGRVMPRFGKARIAVLGDSLAIDVAAGLSMWFRRNDSGVVWDAGVGGCGVARGAWPGEMKSRHRGICDSWPLRAKHWVRDFRPELVVVLTGGWETKHRELPEWDGTRELGDRDYDEWLYGQYVEALDFFAERNLPVVWLTTPCRVSLMGVSTGHFDPARIRHLNENIIGRLAVERADDMILIDYAAELCPGGTYSKSLHGIENFRRDGSHLSKPARLWVGSWLGDQFLEIVARNRAAHSSPVPRGSRRAPGSERLAVEK